MVTPEYPPSALARGLAETIPVMALVCCGGHVLDDYAPPAVADPRDPKPLARDPMLVAAALAAVRQWVFRPALQAGQPIAVWVMVPVRFTPP